MESDVRRGLRFRQTTEAIGRHRGNRERRLVEPGQLIDRVVQALTALYVRLLCPERDLLVKDHDAAGHRRGDSYPHQVVPGEEGLLHMSAVAAHLYGYTSLRRD